ncbi:hypothetical protein K435DRAFT_847633 [Dendrothele bispora CBS 962.96]|uniref:Uncharacterized protein n=1 Tax=Dendrothele bispora (strain CBS 962.96) TaxID=1314807 RepID=A0A4S8MZ43_DENBC|nr:hypothetical protein K435DRAFT_847633 [Dendrothele bispora CBS 962.96]
MSSSAQQPEATTSKKQAVSSASFESHRHLKDALHFKRLQYKKDIAGQQALIEQLQKKNFELDQQVTRLQNRIKTLEDDLEASMPSGTIDADVPMDDSATFDNDEVYAESLAALMQQVEEGTQRFDEAQQNYSNELTKRQQDYEAQETQLLTEIAQLKTNLQTQQDSFTKRLNEKENYIATLTSRNAVSGSTSTTAKDTTANPRMSRRGGRGKRSVCFGTHALPVLPVTVDNNSPVAPGPATGAAVSPEAQHTPDFPPAATSTNASTYPPNDSRSRGLPATSSANGAPAAIGAGVRKPSPRSPSKTWRALMQEAADDAKRRLSKDELKSYRSLARSIWRERHDLDTDAEYVIYEPADSAAVTAYLEGGPGPREDAPLYFGDGYSASPWNRRIIEMLRDLTKIRIQEEYSHLPPVTDFYLENLYSDRLKSVVSYYNLYKKQWKQDEGRLETQEEARKRADRRIAEEHATKAANSLKTRKYNRRKLIADAVVKVKNTENASDLAVWQQWKRGLEVLGVDGQSDEEEEQLTLDGVAEVPVFTVLPAPWRATSMETGLRAIDSMASTCGLFSKSGARALPRVLSGTAKARDGNGVPEPGNDTTGCDNAAVGHAPKGLPRALYRESWLDKLNDVQKEQLEIDDSAFEWSEITYRA